MLQPLGRVALAFLPVFLAACSGQDSRATQSAQDPNGYCREVTPDLIAAAGDPEEPDAPLTETPVEGSACNAVERTFQAGSIVHLTPCTPVTVHTNPPAWGDHYTLFPRFGVYDYAIPRGFYVHSLEHGGIVFTYSCTDCGDEVGAAKALIAENGPDPSCCTAAGCSSDVTSQLSLTPDPGIPSRWAASSWGATLTADCFEHDVFQNFIDAHRDSTVAPENAHVYGAGICANTYAADVTKPGPS
jgi:hypothetical protein